MEKYIPIFVVILVSMAAGYVCQRLRLVGERLAAWLMTWVTVLGYPAISLVAIWKIQPLRIELMWLPFLGCVQVGLLAIMAAPLADILTKDRGERGVFVLASAFGNTGLTMGSFILYVLFGQEGLSLGSLYFSFFTLAVVFLGYPVARHYSSSGPPRPLWRLLVHSLLDWRGLALPISLAGLALSLCRVPVPAAIDRLHVIDVLLYAINVSAYFAIGLRLQMSHAWALKKLVAGLAVSRFALGLVSGLLMVGLTYLTAWPLKGVAVPVMMIQSFVPTAITTVALANMFDLRARESSVLFVVNTLMYLVLVLPPTLWFYGR